MTASVAYVALAVMVGLVIPMIVLAVVAAIRARRAASRRGRKFRKQGGSEFDGVVAKLIHGLGDTPEQSPSTPSATNPTSQRTTAEIERHDIDTLLAHMCTATPEEERRHGDNVLRILEAYGAKQLPRTSVRSGVAHSTGSSVLDPVSNNAGAAERPSLEDLHTQWVAEGFDAVVSAFAGRYTIAELLLSADYDADLRDVWRQAFIRSRLTDDQQSQLMQGVKKASEIVCRCASRPETITNRLIELSEKLAPDSRGRPPTEYPWHPDVAATLMAATTRLSVFNDLPGDWLVIMPHPHPDDMDIRYLKTFGGTVESAGLYALVKAPAAYAKACCQLWELYHWSAVYGTNRLRLKPHARSKTVAEVFWPSFQSGIEAWRPDRPIADLGRAMPPGERPEAAN